MNEIRAARIDTRRVAEIRRAIDAQSWPSFVVGYELEVGSEDGQDVARITYLLDSDGHYNSDGYYNKVEWNKHSDELNELSSSVFTALRGLEGDVISYFRFRDNKVNDDTA